MDCAVVIVSGGMDSVTLAHHLRALHPEAELHLLSFNYGQRHAVELAFAQECAARLGASWQLVDLSGLGVLLSGSSLTDPSVPVPHGHYAEESMKATVVPNRNAIMLSVAFGRAVALGAEVVAFGAHAGDHFIYPDCRPDFYAAMSEALRIGNDGFGDPRLHLEAPFLNWTKADIARRAGELGVPLERTWSCYEGRDIHCGLCGTCTERIEAIREAGLEDLTVYS